MRILTLFVFLLLPGLAATEEASVADWSVRAPLDAVYKSVYSHLEAHRLFVVFEPDIGANLSRFAERWGKDYNRNGLEGIRAMVFCNAWYANAVSNADPRMLALCPMHLTLIHRKGVTHVLYVRPSQVARGTAVESVAKEIESEVAAAVHEAFAALLGQEKRK